MKLDKSNREKGNGNSKLKNTLCMNLLPVSDVSIDPNLGIVFLGVLVGASDM